MKILKKKVDSAFGKKVYLLGADPNNKWIWLEEATWDCGWYWGFGYLETYTNHRKPSMSSDIRSHQHFDGFLWGKDKVYDFDKKTFVCDEYHHHWNESSLITATTLSKEESWQLSDLMKSYYTLREASDIFHSGSSHLCSVKGCDLISQAMYDEINKVLMPRIFEQVYKILTP